MLNIDYWIGFIMADGTLTRGTRKEPKFCLELKLEDKNHLEKLANDLDLDNMVIVYTRKLKGENFINKTSTTCSIKTQKKVFIDFLKKQGIKPNKTKNCKANKRQYNSKSFWRGIIDGDGCLACRLEPSRNRIVPKITLTTGSEELIKQWQSYIFEKCGIEAKYQERKRGGSFDLKVTGNKALKVVTHLYYDAKVSLDRKQQIAEDIMSCRWKKKQSD